MVSSEQELGKIRAAEDAILKHTSKSFVCRMVIPAMTSSTEDVRIYSLVKMPEGNYQSEVIELKLNEGKWSLAFIFKSKVTDENGSKCQAIFKKSIMEVRFPDGPIVGGMDVPIILWECINDDEGSVLLQALKFSEPKDDLKKKELEFVYQILIEN